MPKRSSESEVQTYPEIIFPSKLSHSTLGQLLTMTPKSSIQFLGNEMIRILYANGLFTIAAAILLTDSVLYLHFGLMHHYSMQGSLDRNRFDQ